ncbi:MAG: hypothetical protein JRH18_24810 [Deltaproteobacteria bacterium]|nr:hypothetical protein [Deltaproteobacteria bacterium]MBW2154867.1 hypothetical protein [Deltaproteobacteria bacterium]
MKSALMAQGARILVEQCASVKPVFSAGCWPHRTIGMSTTSPSLLSA